MDELRAMLEHSYLQTSLMHKFFSSRVRELEEAYRILREKTYKALDRREKMIHEYKKEIEGLYDYLETERLKIVLASDGKIDGIEINRGNIAGILMHAVELLEKMKNYKHEEEL